MAFLLAKSLGKIVRMTGMNISAKQSAIKFRGSQKMYIEFHIFP